MVRKTNFLFVISINKRIKKLQTGNCTELFVVKHYKTEYPFRMEKMLHNKFNVKRVLNEWFDLSEHDVYNFLEYCKEIDKTIQIMKDNPFFAKSLK